MNIFSLSLAIYGILNIKKLENIKIYILLPILSFIDSFSLILLTQILDYSNYFHVFSEYFQICFLNFELALIIFFYSNFFIKVKPKLFLLLFFISTFILLYVKYYSGKNLVNDYLPLFVIIEALIVDICFGFLILKKTKEDRSILSNFENQLNKGLFLFVNTTAPYYLIINYIDNSQKAATTYLSFIGSIGYIILFYHIYKAIKCFILK